MAREYGVAVNGGRVFKPSDGTLRLHRNYSAVFQNLFIVTWVKSVNSNLFNCWYYLKDSVRITSW